MIAADERNGAGQQVPKLPSSVANFGPSGLKTRVRRLAASCSWWVIEETLDALTQVAGSAGSGGGFRALSFLSPTSPTSIRILSRPEGFMAYVLSGLVIIIVDSSLSGLVGAGGIHIATSI